MRAAWNARVAVAALNGVPIVVVKTGCACPEDDGVGVTWEENEDGGGHWSVRYEDGVLQGPGEPLEDVESMSPLEAEVTLQEAGLCYRFDHSWSAMRQFEDARLDRELEGYYDRRCSAPVTGEIRELSFMTDYPSGGPGVRLSRVPWILRWGPPSEE